MKKNLYKVLGISQDADPAKIKKAYWKAAKRYHPDVSPGTSKKFREVQEAYEILSDPKRDPCTMGKTWKGHQSAFLLLNPPLPLVAH